MEKKKILVIGDSHVNRINRRKLNYSFKKAQCVVKPFSGAKIEDLEHYIIPNLKQQQPDIAVIHVGSNNVSYKILDTDARLFAENIVEIGKKCVEYGVEHVVISSIFVKESIRLSSLILSINDVLCELCSTNNFHFISNGVIIFRKYLRGDGVHLREMRADIFASKIVHYINRNILGINQDWHDKACSEDENKAKYLSDQIFDDVTSSNQGSIDDLIKLRKNYSKNPILGYLNINSIRNKIIYLRELVSKAPIDIFCIDETKIDESFPNSQLLIENYQFPPYRRDRNSKGGGKTVYVREGLFSKRLKNLESKNTETICMKSQYLKKSGVFYLHTDLQTKKKSLSFRRYQIIYSL